MDRPLLDTLILLVLENEYAYCGFMLIVTLILGTIGGWIASKVSEKIGNV